MPNVNDMNEAQVVAEIAKYEASIANNRARWADSDVSDSALSERAAFCGLNMAQIRLDIIRKGGHEFPVLCKGDEVVATKTERGNWGSVWVIRRPGQKWEYVPFGKEEKRGYTVENRVVPATVTCGNTWIAMATPV